MPKHQKKNYFKPHYRMTELCQLSEGLELLQCGLAALLGCFSSFLATSEMHLNHHILPLNCRYIAEKTKRQYFFSVGSFIIETAYSSCICIKWFVLLVL